jgi:serine/threonine-protein kinase HipA
MANIVQVYLWGTLIGELGFNPDRKTAQNTIIFEFDENIIGSPVQISPIQMNSSKRLHQFPDISVKTFKGLPGVFADSLPDDFGNQLIDIVMAQKNIPPEDITSLDRLMYIGNRGMGAIEYRPSNEMETTNDLQALDLNMLNELAELTNTNQLELAEKLNNADTHAQALHFIKIGSSAGGARSKALIATNRSNGTIKDGTVDHGVDYDYWLLKFDSKDNGDRDQKDPPGMTRVEYIYSIIAQECDIDMPRTHFIEEAELFHFKIERFDRIKHQGKVEKLHYISWCGLNHAHRDTTGSYSYEQLVMTAKQLGLGQGSVTEIFKRAIFNVIGRNQDDHTKNFGFLMDKQMNWSLSPAFDMTYSYDPSGKWTSQHQIRLNTKQGDFELSDLIKFGEYCNINTDKSMKIIRKTIGAFKEFELLAKQYKVPKKLMNTVFRNLRTELS